MIWTDAKSLLHIKGRIWKSTALSQIKYRKLLCCYVFLHQIMFHHIYNYWAHSELSWKGPKPCTGQSQNVHTHMNGKDFKFSLIPHRNEQNTEKENVKWSVVIKSATGPPDLAERLFISCAAECARKQRALSRFAGQEKYRGSLVSSWMWFWFMVVLNTFHEKLLVK